MARLINIECPHGHVVAVDVNDIGRKVRCPICSVMMIVPASAVPQYVAPSGMATPVQLEVAAEQRMGSEVEADQSDELPADAESEVEVRLCMKRVRTALNLYIARLYILVIGFLAIFAWAFGHGLDQEAAGGRGQAKPPEAMTLAVLAGGIVLIVLEIIALAFAFSTPKKTGARGLLMTYTGLQIFFYIMYFVVLFMRIRENVLVGVLSLLLSFAAFVCFILYLKQLAQFQGESKLARKAKGLFWLFGFAIVGILMIYVPRLLEAEGNGRQKQNQISDMAAVFAIVGLLITLVSGIWGILRYVRLLTRLRDSLKVYR